MPEVRWGEDEDRPALLAHGAVQSVTDGSHGYWAAMVPDARPGRTLLLGLGGGTVAHLLCARFGPLPIVAVDDDPHMIALAERTLGDLPSLQVVQADAFRYVAESDERFDLACVDLYRGAQVQGAIVGRPFLRGLRGMLAPKGQAAFNLFLDRRIAPRMHRIGRVFRILRTVRAGQNVVVWCR